MIKCLKKLKNRIILLMLSLCVLLSLTGWSTRRILVVWRPQGVPGILGSAWVVRTKVGTNPAKKRSLGTRLSRYSAFGNNFAVRIAS